MEAVKTDAIAGGRLVQGLAGYIAEGFQRENGGLDLMTDPQAKQRLVDAAEEVVVELTGGKGRIVVNIPYITTTNEGAKHAMCQASRKEGSSMAARVEEWGSC